LTKIENNDYNEVIMNKYPCILLSEKVAFFGSVADTFIGQKVILRCNAMDVIGRVLVAGVDSTEVQLFGNVNGFVLDKTVGVFCDSFIEISLSPSLLGRVLDTFGEPLDGLPAIVPVTKSKNIYKIPVNKPAQSDLIDESYWIYKTESLSLQKGQVVSLDKFNDILPLLSSSNLILVFVELDSQSRQVASIKKSITEYDLENVTLFLQSTCVNDLELLPFSVFQIANYFSKNLMFDVLIVILDSYLLENPKSDNFYFVNSFEQLADGNSEGSISIIKS
jgi:F0F1-type ATP synthase alpha subunit